MGEDVAERRKFIEENALDVVNLDVYGRSFEIMPGKIYQIELVNAAGAARIVVQRFQSNADAGAG